MASFDCMISTVLIRIPFQVVREKNERKKRKMADICIQLRKYNAGLSSAFMLHPLSTQCDSLQRRWCRHFAPRQEKKEWVIDNLVFDEKDRCEAITSEHSGILKSECKFTPRYKRHEEVAFFRLGKMDPSHSKITKNCQKIIFGVFTDYINPAQI